MPRPKSSPFNRNQRVWIETNAAKRREQQAAKSAGSWWLNKDRAAFQAEVKRRHACILNSRNPSVRSLGKVI